jgi:hypothetical protein
MRHCAGGSLDAEGSLGVEGTLVADVGSLGVEGTLAVDGGFLDADSGSLMGDSERGAGWARE